MHHSRGIWRSLARHEVGFYSDDARLLDDLTRFIEAALKAGNAAIVVATESHRDSLLLRLQAHGLDIGAAIEQGRYIALDAADALPKFGLRDVPDPVRFLHVLGNQGGMESHIFQRKSSWDRSMQGEEKAAGSPCLQSSQISASATVP